MAHTSILDSVLRKITNGEVSSFVKIAANIIETGIDTHLDLDTMKQLMYVCAYHNDDYYNVKIIASQIAKKMIETKFKQPFNTFVPPKITNYSDNYQIVKKSYERVLYDRNLQGYLRQIIDCNYTHMPEFSHDIVVGEFDSDVEYLDFDKLKQALYNMAYQSDMAIFDLKIIVRFIANKLASMGHREVFEKTVFAKITKYPDNYVITKTVYNDVIYRCNE